jgi:hypothetical protein
MTSLPKFHTVHTLSGESTLNVSLTCLPTLLQYSSDPIRLIIHDDGSLTESSRDSLRRAVPGVEFIDRQRADNEVGDYLKGYPRCRAARAGNIMFLKMFDVALLERDELSYCDSDILFLRPFRGLFPQANRQFRALFMTDTRESYAVRPWHLRPVGRIRLAGPVNAGLMSISKGVLDLDFVEWLLGQMAQHTVWTRRSYWAEQTCWAALGGRAGCGLWDSRLVAMATQDMAVDSHTAVAIHFVSTYRKYLRNYTERGQPPTEPPVAVGIRPAHYVGPFDQVLSDIRSRFRS